MINISDDFNFKTKEEEVFPRMVQLALVHNICNASCSRCPVGLANKTNEPFKYSQNKNINKFLPFETYKVIVQSMVGIDRTILRLHGRGEPLLHPDIVDMVHYAKIICNIPTVTMFTNGIALDKNMALSLLKNKLDVFDISVDAFNESTYFKYRGTKNWQKVLDNVTFLIEQRNALKSKSKIVVSAVLDEEFEEIKSEFQEFWKLKGTDVAILRPYHNYAGRLKQNGKEYKQQYTPCPQLFTRFSINTNGEVNQCFHDWSDDYIVGEITNLTSIRNIWSSSHYKELRAIELNQKSRLNNNLCKECKIQPNAWSYSYELLLKKLGVIKWDKI